MKSPLTNKSTLLVFLLTWLAVGAKAQSILSREYFAPYTNFVDVDIHITDDRYANLASGTGVDFRDKTAYGIVSVGFDPDMNICYPQAAKFKITVQAIEKIISTPGSVTTQTNQYELIVNYDPLLQSLETEQAFVVIPNARDLELSIVSVKAIDISGNETSVATPNVLPADVYVEAELVRERYFNFNPTLSTSVPTIITPALGVWLPLLLEHNVHLIEWANVDGASEYEVEWTYVDDFLGPLYSDVKPNSQIWVNFKNNATSVRVPRKAANTFYIPSIYSRGYIVYRVRAIGRGGAALDDDVFGPWSLSDDNFLSAIPASHIRTSSIIGYTSGVNGYNNLNVQYALQFAEEGKLLASGTFADGTLRVRQNVTAVKIDETEDYGKKAVITETMYDHLGRPAINTLPAVTKNGLWYTPNYNVNTSGQKYSYLDFDTDNSLVGPCITGGSPMDTTSGASQYYSSNNPFKTEDFQGLIADAHGYPFIQTTYERDNTQKPKIQTGVGSDHRMGSGHETKYIYGGAEAIQLNRLFGTDAGYAEYYQKNMVFDANGQISITYTDMAGRTVATSLAGKVPDNLQPLVDDEGNPLATSGDVINDDMLNLSTDHPNGSSNPLSDDGRSFIFNKTLLIDAEQDYRFSYSALLADFEDSCFTFCLDCIYDLEISLTDECGNFLIGNNDSSSLKITIPSLNVDTICNDTNEIALPDFVIPLTPGSYTLYKKLSINDSAMNAYVDLMMENSDCLLSIDDFYQTPDTSGCYITCESCMENIGTWEEFYTQEKIDSGFGGDSALAYQTLWPVYNSMQEECEAICASATDRDFCEGIYRLMLMDMSPGGQYAQYDDDYAGTVDAANYPVSIFNTGNYLPQKKSDLFYSLPPASSAVITSILATVPSWRKPVYFDKANLTEPYKAGYYDNLGQRERVYIQRDDNDAFYPPVVDETQVVTVDESLNQYYTFHENLLNLSDFLDRRPSNIGQSLVIYHPEFTQYSYCASVYPYTETVDGDVVNTFGFDGKLAAMNFTQATTLLGTNVTLADLFTDMMAVDPFFANHPLASVSYASFPDMSPRTLLENRFQNFQTLVVPTNMAQMAYIQNTCAYDYPVGCGVLPGTVWGGLIHDDATWKTFVDYYVSAKQEVLLQSMFLYGLFGATPGLPTNWNKVINSCIGSDSYFPVFDLTSSPGTLLTENPCNFPYFIHYRQKQKRIGSTQNSVAEGFGLSDPPTLDELNQYAGQGYYNQTGRCPMVSDLEFLLGKLTLDRQSSSGPPQLTASLLNLSDGGYMGSGLYNHINPTADVMYTTAIAGATLTATVTELDCNPFTLTLPGAATSAGYDFDDIQAIFSIHNIAQIGIVDYSFTAKAIFYDASISAMPETLDLAGTTCLPLTGCENTFKAICKPTDVAKDLMNLMSYLSLDGELFNTSGYTLGSVFGTGDQYALLVTSRLKQYLGTAGSYTWRYYSSPSPGHFVLAGGGNQITLTLSAPMGLTLGDTYQFTSITGSATSNPVSAVFSDFTLTAVEVDPGSYFPPLAGAPGTTTYTLEGDISVIGVSSTFPVTECAPLRPLECNTLEHNNLYELQDLFELWAQGISPLEAQADCITEMVSSDPSFDVADMQEIMSAEADMELSDNAVTSNHFTLVVKMDDNSLDTLTGTYCLPLRNCITCEDEPDTCRNTVFTVRFPEDFEPQNGTAYRLSGSCIRISPSTFTYSHASPDDYWEAYAAAIETDMGSGVSADVIGGALVLFITDPELLASCPCNDETNTVLLRNGKTTIASFTATCCETDAHEPCEPQDFVTFKLRFPDGFVPGENEHISFTGSCFELEPSTFSYDHTDIDAYWEAYAAVLEANGYTTTYSNGTLYLVVTDPDIATKCPCDDPENTITIANGSLETLAVVTSDCCEPPIPLLFQRNTNEWVIARSDVDEEGGWEPWETYAPSDDCNPDVFPFPQEPLPPNECVQFLLETAQANAEYQYQQYLDEVREQYKQLYISKCMGPVRENFEREFQDGQYHYTLYYYDRAGNLVKTVPPHAVTPLTGSNLAAVNNARDNHTVEVPDHNKPGVPAAFDLSTRYRFNSLNQPIEQISPDGGKSNFFYDRLGRVAVSQNAQQAFNSLSTDKLYSYTLYDLQGRITEVGQMVHNAVATRTGIYEFGSWSAFFNYAYVPQEVTRTVYDVPYTGTLPVTFTQNNLRSRVSYTQNQPKDNPDFNFGTFYDYDIHGNVKSLVHENLWAPATPFQQNQVDYTYDLVSGVVKKVRYNAGKSDQYFHKYEYDDQNRLTQALTSRNDYKYDIDANYFYYWHGPLARTEMGHNKVQGTDYAYTLQGWLKSANSDGLQGFDPGLDGYNNVSNPNRYFARDAYGYSLNYYTGDYSPIVGTYQQTPALPTGYLYADLWNGNIAAMNNSLRNPNDYSAMPLLQRFGYDQLNRIARSEAYNLFEPNYNLWAVSPVPLQEYATSYVYDPAGNLQYLNRYGNKIDSLDMDSLDYEYYPLTNQLRQVRDHAVDAAYHTDIKDQVSYTDNYVYDKIGNLIKDENEEIETIEWTLYGKVSRVIRKSGSTKPDLEFHYDPAGRRIMKMVYPNNGDPRFTEYYVHDAQGNVLTIYQYFPTLEKHLLKEQMIYGSSRLGSWKSDRELLSYIPPSPQVNTVTRGEKHYELSDHLGNVHSVVSDRKKRVCDDDEFMYYDADIRNAYDYYAFGMLMPGRVFSAPLCDTVFVDTTLVVFNETFASGTGGFTGLSSGTVSQVSLMLQVQRSGCLACAAGWGTSKTFAQQNGTTYSLSFSLSIGTCSGRTITARVKNPSGTVLATQNYTAGGTYTLSFTADQTGTGSVEFIVATTGSSCAFFLDNVKVDYETTLAQMDCGGGDVEGSYRFGFNGQEKLDDLYGEGNAYDFGARIYDPRLGKWLAVDPLKSMYPGFSPYSFSANNPLYYTDAEGETVVPMNEESYQYMEGQLRAALTTTDNIYVMEGIFTATKDASGTYTYQKVDMEKFEAALTGLSEDQQAIARGYAETMNLDYKYEVHKVTNESKQKDYIQDPNSVAKVGNKTVGDAGGGVFIPNGPGKGVILVGDKASGKTTVGQEQKQTYKIENGEEMIDKPSEASNIASLGEIFVHEMIGEGLGYVYYASMGNRGASDLFAIQAGNIMKRIIEGANAPQRNGFDHSLNSKGAQLSTAVPTQLGGDGITPMSTQTYKAPAQTNSGGNGSGKKKKP